MKQATIPVFIRNKILFLAFLIILIACNDDPSVIPSDKADLLSYVVVQPAVTGLINTTDSSIYFSFSPDLMEAEDLVADFTISEGASLFNNDVEQVSGITRNNFERIFVLHVVAENKIVRARWTVFSSNNSFTQDWGLGRFITAATSNDRDYEWYLDQANTGSFSGINCGPTSTTMAALWSDGNFDLTPMDARSTYRSDGGWWYTSDIRNYLEEHEIPNYTIALADTRPQNDHILIEELDAGHIMILCLDMYYVRENSTEEQRVDKFYNTAGADWGHFIVVKGYRVVDGNYFWEVYDPFSFNKKYLDGSLKGKNRYYRSKDIFEATSIWWNYAIVVTAKGLKSEPVNAVNINNIPDQTGR